ncbi:MAG TPA: antibiotic biosynthesis monooxygenase family protein [Mycobacteriales bacterium]|jgi:Uncharacterized enzyme involved in biosynthesis of extracellular polysaccharides
MTEPHDRQPGVFRVILRMDVYSGGEAEFERVWADIATVVAENPASLGQWLMRGCDGQSVYYVISDWRDEAAFREFETSPAHQEHRRRLAPLRHGGWMITAQVVHSVATRGAPV